MKALQHERYGPDGLALREVPAPVPADDEVVVRVRASSVNPVEWYGVHGPPFVRVFSRQFRRPTDPSVGGDAAGVVEAVGRGVDAFSVGDEVFGSARSAWAELALAAPEQLAAKPAALSFEEAAGAPVAGLTALLALRDHAAVQPGQKVLVNGASGGVGTFTVQLAKALGADVTAVCSTQNVELVRSLGADRVVDYTRDDFTRLRERHDVIVDIAGSRSFLRFRRVLTPDAKVIVVGAKMSYSLLGPLKHIAATHLQSIGRSQTVKFFVAHVRTADLELIGDLMTSGKVRTVIDRTYDLADAADALAYLGEGHARGKIVLRVSS